MHQYKLISRKGEGTFSEVLKAQSIKTGNYVAIKCMKTHFNSVEQVNQLREIQALRKTSPHPNIIKLLEILYDEPTGRLALVFELMEMNMYELIKDRKTYLPQNKIKHYMYQIMKALDQMHRKGVFHRDIKPENILLLGDLVKVADLGSCRGMYGEHPYTEYISTRWYRSPECLMTDGYYDHKMDIWGVGCVMFEILTLVPLFPGKNELDMIHRIHNILGTPPQSILDRFKSHASHLDFNFPQKAGTGLDKMLSHVSADCLDLLKQMLTYDPEKRITATQALQHEYFNDIIEAEKQKEFHTTLNSMGTSPSFKQFQQSLYNEQTSVSGKTGMKKKPAQAAAQNPYSTINKFGSVNVKVKVEGVYKNDTSTEEEPDKGQFLPQIEPKYVKQKKEESKKLSSVFLKQGNPYYNSIKKPAKNSGNHEGLNYYVVGKKAV